MTPDMTPAIKPWRPVFVVGCERSGTTVLGAMLGSHPSCVCLPESQFIVESLAEFGRGPVDAGRLLGEIRRHWRFQHWGIEPPAVISGRSDAPICYPDVLEALIADYAVKLGKPSAEVWIEHSPRNVKHLFSLREAFPAAKIVHIVRDGRAVAASHFGVAWGPSTVQSAARYWMERLSYGLAARDCFGPEIVHQVRYEDLVGRPEETMREIAAFVGLPYLPDMLKTDSFELPRFTQRQHRLVGQPPDSSRSTAWRRQLTPRQIEMFEWMTADMLRYHGYELSSRGAPRPVTRVERLTMWLQDSLLKIIHRIAGTFAGQERPGRS